MKEKWFYLWYTVVLCFPPLHELGHVIIGWAIGEEITGAFWDHVLFGNITGYHFLQEAWQYSTLVPLFCAFLFLGIMLKDVRIIRNRRKEGVCV